MFAARGIGGTRFILRLDPKESRLLLTFAKKYVMMIAVPTMKAITTPFVTVAAAARSMTLVRDVALAHENSHGHEHFPAGCCSCPLKLIKNNL
jgi:hypothetical protein